MKIFLFGIVNLLSFSLFAQCTIDFNSDTIYACANVPVQFIASAPAITTTIDSCDFNAGLTSGWSASGATSFGQPCLNGLDGTPYYWSSDANNLSREVISPSVDFSTGGVLNFDFRCAIQGGSMNCEGPDGEEEGMEIQYSLDNGGTWITFSYFNPIGIIESSNPGANPTPVNGITPFTSWANYSILVPTSASSLNTMFRWRQTDFSITAWDNWGLDNIKIGSYPNGLYSSWNTGGINMNAIDVSSTVDTSFVYSIFDQLGNTLCSDTCYLLIPSIGYDNNVQLISQTFTSGDQSVLFLDAFNDGCPIQNGEVSIILDSLLSFDTSNPLPSQIMGDTLIYDYTNLYINGPHFVVPITVTTSPFAQVGDSINISVLIMDSIGDVAVWNNEKNYNFPVLASYDPNDKKVYPTGECTPGYIYNDEILTYTIRFQNTGTASATNVVISDQIDTDLDLSTLKVVASSHGLNLAWPGGNTVEFKFDSINLPHQAADDLGSNGYVVFEISQAFGLAHDTELTNYVDIYFDLNPPITTNEVLNTVSDGSHHIIGDTLVISSSTAYTWNGQTFVSDGIYSASYSSQNGCDSTVYLDLVITTSLDESSMENIEVYPNPTSDWITLDYGAVSLKKVSLFDAYGQELNVLLEDDNGSFKLELDYPNGVYFLRIESENAKRTFKLVKW